MEKKHLILVSYYCQQTNTSIAYVESLEEYGLIQTLSIAEDNYVHSEDIAEIERVNRLQEELGINLEGIDALNHLLQKVNHLEKQLKITKERLRIYEP